MLKLEKASKLSNVTIRMRERDRFLEPRLLKALAIALILHIGALFLFHVTPFSFISTFSFPPVIVQSDFPVTGVSTLIFHERDEDEIPPPPLSLIPSLDWISFSPEFALAPSVTYDLKAMESLEKRIWPKWEEPLSLRLEEPRIHLTISGDLAELSLIASDPLLDQMQPISHGPPTYVTYKVQLDENTGEIFWYERLESSAVATVEKFTERILLNLRFSPPESDGTVIGTLNFAIQPLAGVSGL